MNAQEINGVLEKLLSDRGADVHVGERNVFFDAISIDPARRLGCKIEQGAATSIVRHWRKKHGGTVPETFTLAWLLATSKVGAGSRMRAEVKKTPSAVTRTGCRFGSPVDFCALIEACHDAGLGVMAAARAFDFVANAAPGFFADVALQVGVAVMAGLIIASHNEHKRNSRRANRRARREGWLR
jgi:heme exporter protein D